MAQAGWRMHCVLKHHQYAASTIRCSSSAPHARQRLGRRICQREIKSSPSNRAITARVIGPKQPVAGKPLAFWNCASALRVRDPKKSVSLPGAPEPLFVMMNPWALRNCCRRRTSSPVSFRRRSREKLEAGLAGATSAFICDSMSAEMGYPSASSCAMRDWSCSTSEAMKDCVVDGTVGAGAPPLFGRATAAGPLIPPAATTVGPLPLLTTITLRDALDELPAASVAV